MKSDLTHLLLLCYVPSILGTTLDVILFTLSGRYGPLTTEGKQMFAFGSSDLSKITHVAKDGTVIQYQPC